MYSKYIDYLKEHLNEHRFIHTMNVAEKSASLAKMYGADENKAYLCGLLHDICKNDSEEKMLQCFKKFGIILDDVQKCVPLLWHSIAGAVIIKEKFNINDIEIINAVRYHTTGRENMTKLDKIIYLADIISDDRDFDGVEELRKTANEDLDLAVFKCLQSSIRDILSKNRPVHIDTVKAYNYLAIERMY